jgi:hypothetical protein
MARQVAVSSLLAQERAGGLPVIEKTKFRFRGCVQRLYIKTQEAILPLSSITLLHIQKQNVITIGGTIFLRTSTPL